MRRIAVVTGTRAEYGLLQGLCRAILSDPDTTLQLLVTGAHLSEKFGATVAEIEADRIPIAARIEILDGTDTSADITLAMAKALTGFSRAFTELRPDLVVVLGDRYETFAAATAAFVAQVPIAHIHGGEVTEAAMDDSFRHAITKLSQIHFPVADDYRDRILQMGEEPSRVYNFGPPALDNIRGLEIVNRSDLSRDVGLDLKSPLIVATFHPVTLELGRSTDQCCAMLGALAKVPEACIVITQPNADPENAAVLRELERFKTKHSERVSLVASLGRRRYLSLLAIADLMIGNSSSGLLEAPYFGVPTVNIGNRQKGRLAAPSVISCEPNEADISSAIRRAFDPTFRAHAKTTAGSQGGDFAARALKVLKRIKLDGLMKKPFYTTPFQGVV